LEIRAQYELAPSGADTDDSRHAFYGR